MREPDEQKRGGRRVDVRDQIRGPDARQHAGGEDADGQESEPAADPPGEAVECSIGEEEADLLQSEPHEGEVQESDPLDAADPAEDVDRDGRAGENAERAQRCPRMQAGEHRQQRLAQQEDAEEPQRLAEPVARDEQQVRRHARRRQHDEADPRDGDRGDGGQQQAVHARRDEGGGRTASAPGPPVGGESRESADDEEQRHDLQHPAQRRDPRRALARVREDRAGIRDGDADHERMQHDDAEHAEGADEVDPGVPVSRLGRHGGLSGGVWGCDRHGCLLGVAPRLWTR
ncbi:hypothetical protein GCM10027408_17820 [Microbacterium tumbae]